MQQNLKDHPYPEVFAACAGHILNPHEGGTCLWSTPLCHGFNSKIKSINKDYGGTVMHCGHVYTDKKRMRSHTMWVRIVWCPCYLNLPLFVSRSVLEMFKPVSNIMIWLCGWAKIYSSGSLFLFNNGSLILSLFWLVSEPKMSHSRHQKIQPKLKMWPYRRRNSSLIQSSEGKQHKYNWFGPQHVQRKHTVSLFAIAFTSESPSLELA